MRRLALLAAAATGLGAHATEMLSNATQEAEASSQVLSSLVGSNLDLESIKSLPAHKQELLCIGTVSSGSVDKAAVRLALGQSRKNDVDKVHQYLEERCQHEGDGPVTNIRALYRPPRGNRHEVCEYLEKAHRALRSSPFGKIGETLGLGDLFSRKFGKYAFSDCGVLFNPHPDPSKPFDYRALKPDPCQAAVSVKADGTFELPKGCGESPSGHGSSGHRPHGHHPGKSGPPWHGPQGHHSGKSGSTGRGRHGHHHSGESGSTGRGQDGHHSRESDPTERRRHGHHSRRFGSHGHGPQGYMHRPGKVGFA